MTLKFKKAPILLLSYCLVNPVKYIVKNLQLKNIIRIKTPCRSICVPNNVTNCSLKAAAFLKVDSKRQQHSSNQF